MIQVASLKHKIIFQKGFSNPDVFAGFVRDFAELNPDPTTTAIHTDFNLKLEYPPIDDLIYAIHGQNHTSDIIIGLQHTHSGDDFHYYMRDQSALILYHSVQSRSSKNTICTLILNTGDNLHQSAFTTSNFDFRDDDDNIVIKHPYRLHCISPKYVNEAINQAQTQWMHAIEDTYDGQVNASNYTIPEIQQLFEIIRRDQVTTEEQALMTDNT